MLLLFHETVVNTENDTESWLLTLTDAVEDDTSGNVNTGTHLKLIANGNEDEFGSVKN